MISKMAYTERVFLSGTALSFLLYECVNTSHSQEGFLIGDTLSEIVNQISDAHNDNAHLDTRISIRTVLPMPSISLFYSPTGKIREDVMTDLLSKSKEVIGWYKFRKNSNLKPSFRDKLIAKGLQKYFEKMYNKKHFVTCILSNKVSTSNSTHTYMYRFGKINCYDMFEYIEDVTANLGEKIGKYKKSFDVSPHSIFKKIIKENNIDKMGNAESILNVQKAIHLRLTEEARIAAKNEYNIRELESEIMQISMILSDSHCVNLKNNHNQIIEDELKKRENELADACLHALDQTQDTNSEEIINHLKQNTSDNSKPDSPILINNEERSRSPVLTFPSVKTLNYASALKRNSERTSTNKTKHLNEDLIIFEDEKKSEVEQVSYVNTSDSSPEY